MNHIAVNNDVALLIDADNGSLKYIEDALKLSEYYGRLTICRAYGDWKKAPLDAWHEKIDALNIECVQVNRNGKNATDHRMLIEVGEILGASSEENNVDGFAIVSGDGDFAIAAEWLREKGNRVIGIGSRDLTSAKLQKSCDEFYFAEDLAHELGELEKRFPISPQRLRSFFPHVIAAYENVADKFDRDWISYGHLGKTLHNMEIPDYDNQFGKPKLSVWMQHFESEFEIRDQMVRRIDLRPEATRSSLMEIAYFRIQQDGRVNLSRFGEALRELDPYYANRFGRKKLSEWITDYPELFIIHENYAIHRDHWQE